MVMFPFFNTAFLRERETSDAIIAIAADAAVLLCGFILFG
jgi:hypothetical protein